MTYRNLMVRLQLNGDNRGVLQITAELADRFSANVIGIAACQPIQPVAGEGFHPPEVILQDREEITRELRAAETEFREALSGCPGQLEWRSAITYSPLADHVAQEARSADLIITAKDQGLGLLDESRKVHLGDLAMQAGRPILVVPKGIDSLPLRHVFIGWKDTREARRAAFDALPLLNAVGRGTVVEVAPEHQHEAAQARLDDVSRWLKRHDVDTTCRILSASGTEASFLHAFLLDNHCDLLVAGAFGHSRLKEWVFGGVTQDVLLNPPFCVLLAH